MGVFVCGVVTGIVALVLASQAQQKITASNGQLTGAGMVTAARVIAIIAIALNLIVIVVFIGTSSREHLMSYVPPPPPPPPRRRPRQPQWGAPPRPGAPVYAPPRTDGTAIAALVLSIVSWVLCPIIAAVVALVLAHVAGNKIDASGGRLTGNGLVRAAQIIAWVHIVLFTLVMVGIAIALVANDSSSSSLRALVG